VVTLHAQRANVFQIAFTAALDDGENMVGVPEAFAEQRSRRQAPMLEDLQPGCASQSFEITPSGQAIHATLGANTTVAFQYFFAKIARVSAQPPLVHAPIRTEGMTALGDLQITPAAEVAPIRSFRKGASIGPTAGHRPCRAHGADYDVLMAGFVNRPRCWRRTCSTLFTWKEQEYTGRHLTLREVAVVA
jgi:hypothetical protein